MRSLSRSTGIDIRLASALEGHETLVLLDEETVPLAGLDSRLPHLQRRA